MNEKILISSIITIIILVGVSFTSVVGYQSVESNIGVSPLFNIRSSRAIDEKSGDLSCEYVGKEDDFNLFIPGRNDREGKIRQIIEFVQKMDDKEFNRFVDLVINGIQKNDDSGDIYRDDIILVLSKLRNHQELLILNNYNINENYTFRSEFIPTMCWFPGCIPLRILGGILTFFILIVMLYGFLYTDWTADCVSPT